MRQAHLQDPPCPSAPVNSQRGQSESCFDGQAHCLTRESRFNGQACALPRNFQGLAYSLKAKQANRFSAEASHLKEGIWHATCQLSLTVLPWVWQNTALDPVGKTIFLSGISKLDYQRHFSARQNCLCIMPVYSRLGFCPLAKLDKSTSCKRQT